jgi:hypothetical protein
MAVSNAACLFFAVVLACKKTVLQLFKLQLPSITLPFSLPK